MLPSQIFKGGKKFPRGGISPLKETLTCIHTNTEITETLTAMRLHGWMQQNYIMSSTNAYFYNQSNTV
jgi:hypothetical protein